MRRKRADFYSGATANFDFANDEIGSPVNFSFENIKN